MNCKCKDCKHSIYKTEIISECKLKKMTVISNATCKDSEEREIKEKEFINEFLHNLGIQ